MRDIITLRCTACHRKNYSTTKNRKTLRVRLELRKYCSWCRRHVAHREAR